jgi:hypothetical protein
MIKFLPILIFLLSSCHQNIQHINSATIIPKPQETIVKNGVFNLGSYTNLEFDSCFYDEADFLKSILQMDLNGEKNSIILKHNETIRKEEYYLKICE